MIIILLDMQLTDCFTPSVAHARGVIIIMEIDLCKEQHSDSLSEDCYTQYINSSYSTSVAA